MPINLTFKDLARGSLVAANRLVSVLDRPFGKQPAEASDSLFIVGLPRSGTTLAYELVAHAFDVAYFSKVYNYTFGLPNLTTRLATRFGRRPAPKYESSYGSIQGAFAPAEHHHFWRSWFPEHARLGHYVPKDAIPDSGKRAMNKALASLGEIAGRPFVFKDVYLTLSVEAVLEKVRGSRLLVISRDTDAVAASVYRKRSQIGGTGDWWSIRPPLSDTVATSSLPEQVAFQCVRSRQLLERQLARADAERIRVVEYAAICDSPRSFIEGLRDWLGNDFGLRDEFSVPERFEVRPSVGFPADVADAYAHAAAHFEKERDTYLAEVDGLASRGDDAARAGPETEHR